MGLWGPLNPSRSRGLWGPFCARQWLAIPLTLLLFLLPPPPCSQIFPCLTLFSSAPRERKGFLSQLCWLIVVMMVGNTPNTTVVPLASTLLTNLSLFHSVFQCTSWAWGVSLTALLTNLTEMWEKPFRSWGAPEDRVGQGKICEQGGGDGW